jgi:hypothetical protein
VLDGWAECQWSVRDVLEPWLNEAAAAWRAMGVERRWWCQLRRARAAATFAAVSARQTLRHGGVHAGTVDVLALRPGAMTRVPRVRSSGDGVSARQHWRLPVMGW